MLCLTVFVNCLSKQFTIFLGEVAIFLLNVMVQFCGVSASRIILVKILLAVCMSSGMVVCEKANSVSFVN